MSLLSEPVVSGWVSVCCFIGERACICVLREMCSIVCVCVREVCEGGRRKRVDEVCVCSKNVDANTTIVYDREVRTSEHDGLLRERLCVRVLLLLCASGHFFERNRLESLSACAQHGENGCSKFDHNFFFLKSRERFVFFCVFKEREHKRVVLRERTVKLEEVILSS